MGHREGAEGRSDCAMWAFENAPPAQPRASHIKPVDACETGGDGAPDAGGRPAPSSPHTAEDRKDRGRIGGSLPCFQAPPGPANRRAGRNTRWSRASATGRHRRACFVFLPVGGHRSRAPLASTAQHHEHHRAHPERMQQSRRHDGGEGQRFRLKRDGSAQLRQSGQAGEILSHDRERVGAAQHDPAGRHQDPGHEETPC